MNVKFRRRLVAYVFDILIISMVLSVIGIFIPEGNNIKVLNEEMGIITEKALKRDISFGNYIYQYSDIAYQLDRNKVMINIVNVALILVYFVFVPYFRNGQTFGKTWMKIKIVRDDGELISLNDLIIRNMITNGLAYTLIGLSCIYLVPSLPYFIIISILGIIQVIVVFYSAFMIIYKQDKRGLQDIITKTRVIESK